MNLPLNYTELDTKARRACREEYVIHQDNKCYYCKSSLSEQPPKSILSKWIEWGRKILALRGG